MKESKSRVNQSTSVSNCNFDVCIVVGDEDEDEEGDGDGDEANLSGFWVADKRLNLAYKWKLQSSSQDAFLFIYKMMTMST